MASNSNINEVKQDIISETVCDSNAAQANDISLDLNSKLVKFISKMFKTSPSKTVKILKIVGKVTGAIVSILTVVLSVFRKFR